MTRKGKAQVNPKKATSAVKSKTALLELQKRIVKAPVEVELLDSDDDDFAVPKKTIVREQKNTEIEEKTKASFSGFVHEETYQNLNSIKNCDDEDSLNILEDAFIYDEIELKGESGLVSSSVRSCCSNAAIYESKDAWKNLMQRMQNNQKGEITKNPTKSKGRNSSKTGATKQSVSLPKKLQPKVVSSFTVAVEDDCVVVPSTEGANATSELNESDHQKLHKAYSPPKRLKMDELSVSAAVLEEEQLPSQPLEAIGQDTTNPRNADHAPSNGSIKIPTMFLKPEERAARALQEKLEKAKLCESVCPQEVLAQLAKEPVHYTSALESREYFEGNLVKLNPFVPVEDPYGGTKTKQCPFYKKLPGTKFSVDAFNYGLIPGIEVYFLSHYHSDHYIGLTKKFCKTLICSPPTANLVRMKLGVDDKCIRRLQLNKPYIVDGVEVILISANHCPGSVMFIFKLANGTIYFHTGDFRFTVDMLENHFLQGLRIDLLYLDTTYCDPKYDFPTQTDAITELIAAVKRKVNFRPKTLILCGSYLIGKERVYFSLAEALQTKVYMNSEKRRIIKALENPLYDSYVSSTEETAQIHVTQMFSIEPKFLSEYLSTRPKYTHIIGIKPSGWQFSSSGSGTAVKSFNNDTVTIIGVPYSEHSRFSELEHFITATKPKKIQPTVNVGSASKRTAMMDHITKWQAVV